MHDVLAAKPLQASSAHEAYPLVRLVAPTVSEERWREFASDWLALPQCRAGIVGVRNRPGVVLAVFAWRLSEELELRRALRIAHLFIAGLPGRSLGDFVIDAIADEAARRNCTAIVIEKPAPDFSGRTRLPDACLADAGFTRHGEIVMRTVLAGSPED